MAGVFRAPLRQPSTEHRLTDVHAVHGEAGQNADLAQGLADSGAASLPARVDHGERGLLLGMALSAHVLDDSQRGDDVR